MKYICTEDFSLQMYNEDGFIMEGKLLNVHKGDIFSSNESNFRVLGTEIRIENDTTWLELTAADLARYFSTVEE